MSSGIHSEHNERSFHFSVRSGVLPPSQVHERIDAFLAGMGSDLEAMPDADVQASIDASKESFSQPHPNLAHEHARLLTEILNGTHCWKREEVCRRPTVIFVLRFHLSAPTPFLQCIVSELATLTKADIVSLFRTHFVPNKWDEAPCRRVFAAYSYCDKHAAEELDAVRTRITRRINDETEARVLHVPEENPLPWQDTMPLFPCHAAPRVFGEKEKL